MDSFAKAPSFTAGLHQHDAYPGSQLLDVRSPRDYEEGHIPGSINLPLEQLNQVGDCCPDKSKPLYVYCRSGQRSAQAVQQLRGMGYEKAEDIGGIQGYEGYIES